MKSDGTSDGGSDGGFERKVPAAPAAGDSFPSTRWSRVIGGAGAVGAGGRAGERGGPDLEALARAYWRPVRAYVQALGRLATADAEDATQDFFVWLIERDRLAKADPARGRFRAFLKTALRHFAIDRERRRLARKRGGAVEHVSLADAAACDGELAASAPAPEAALDEAWRAELVARATARLESELRESGRERTFELFRDYFLAPDEGVDYAALATRHGISSASVSNHLMEAKRRFRSLLRLEASETVTDAESLAEELRWLFGEAGP